MLKEALKSSCFSRNHTIYEHLQKKVTNEFIRHITIYGDRTSSFEELLNKDGSVTIHTRNLQILATDMFHIYKNLSPTIVVEIFRAVQNNYNLRQSSLFSISYFKIV